jgi:hypothetical protein
MLEPVPSPLVIRCSGNSCQTELVLGQPGLTIGLRHEVDFLELGLWEGYTKEVKPTNS